MTLERQYADALSRLINTGVASGDRTGTGTFRVQHQYFCIDLANEGLPVLAGKKMMPKNALVEIAWMVSGSTNIAPLKKWGVNYWDKWADKNGDLGPIYGKQMRDFSDAPFDVPAMPCVGADQLTWCLGQLKHNPNSRQICMSLWNPLELDSMKLPPCHCFYQFVCVNGIVDLHVYQRSADSFLGVPYDFLLFSYLLIFMCQMSGLGIGKIHYTCADFHLYQNHLAQAVQYLQNVNNDPEKRIVNNTVPLKIYDYDFFKKLTLISGWDELWPLLEAYKFDVFDFNKYSPYGFIKAEVSV